MLGELIATRDAFSKALVEFGSENTKVVVLDADLAHATMSCKFQEAVPERFFNVGIAEADLVDMAAGLSTTGKIPFACTFAVFSTGRAFEQIRNSIAYPRLNVKICGSHGGPDISTFKVSSAKLYASNGLLAGMTSSVDAWEDASQISDAAWQIARDGTGDGTLSLLPWTLEPLYVYYRPSYFEAADVEVPTTIDEFMDAVEKLTRDTDGDGVTDVYGSGMRGAGGGHEHLGNFRYAYGASWDDLTTPEAVEAYKAYLSIYQNGYAPESAVNAAFAELTDGFSSGLTSMIIHHIGSSTQWIEQFGDNVDAFVFPGSDKGQWTCTGDTEMAILENCENKEAAFEFYKFMTTGEGGTIWFKGTGKGLGTPNITATEEYAANRFQAVSAEGMAVAGILPPTETLSEFINNVWAPTNQQALLGEITPEEALAIMNEALHDE